MVAERKEKLDYMGKEEKFAGKHGEKWHPYDRRSGTGRGRGEAKGGHGRNNWGDTADVVKYGEEVPEGEVPKKVEFDKEGEGETFAEEEGKPTPKTGREADEVPAEEEEEKGGLTFQEYQAMKKKATIKKEAR